MCRTWQALSLQPFTLVFVPLQKLENDLQNLMLVQVLYDHEITRDSVLVTVCAA